MLLQVSDQGVEAAGGQHPVAGQHIEVALARVLRQITDLAAAHHGAGVGIAGPGEDPHRRGLTGTVASHQPDPVTGLNPQHRPFGEQQGACAGADLEVRCGDHCPRPSSIGRAYLSSVKTGARC